MRAVAINFILIDCDPGYAAHWNRWYDTDHLAEFLGLPGVVGTRRYVATAALQRTRIGPAAEGLASPDAAYCTIVLVGPDVAGAEVGRAGMAATHNRLMGVPGRMPDWERIAPRYIEGFDLAAIVAGSSPVAPDALLHVAHRGVLVELWDIDDAGAAARWLDTVHIPALAAAEGVLAVARFTPGTLPPVEAPWEDGQPDAGAGAAPAGPVRLLVLVQLEADPESVLDELRARSDGTVPPSGARRVFHGVYRTIDPLEYGFVDER